MEKIETTDKPLFDNLRKLINLIDSFRDVGLHEHIELPRIAVLGMSFIHHRNTIKWKIITSGKYCGHGLLAKRLRCRY